MGKTLGGSSGAMGLKELSCPRVDHSSKRADARVGVTALDTRLNQPVHATRISLDVNLH